MQASGDDDYDYGCRLKNVFLGIYLLGNQGPF